ncbi:transposase [Emticicia sp. BO119]|uniref:transposase n=1 Tax=Emticicia sp. BO119 TaxID=2757768 RepID=UPI0015F03092|nr:transposase [Emticicia sp. BO119]
MTILSWRPSRGVKLHCLGKDRFEQIPKPSIIRIRAANVHDLTAAKPITSQLNNQYVIGDRAYASESLNQLIKQNNSAVLTPLKRKKGQRTKSADDNLISKYISAVRQPIESFFRWLINKTDIQNAAKVRSEKALWTHCFGRIASALILFIINP